MKTDETIFHENIDRLLDVLDTDIENIHRNLSALNQLRSSVIKRDNDCLAQLLKKIQAEAGGHKNNESKRKSIRKELAHSLGCPAEKVTLTSLAQILPEEKKGLITERKEKLTELLKQLKNEYHATAVLLSECSRFNRILLKTLFDNKTAETVTYDAEGSALRHFDSAFVNMKL
jgi:hypothetical protein